MLRRENPVVLLDGDCVLCNRFAKYVIAHDPSGRFLFAALGTRRAREILASVGVSREPRGTLLLVGGGECLTKSAAVLRILEGLPFPHPLLARAASKVPLPLRDAVYSFVASVRKILFGRVRQCALLTPAERRRLLED